VTITIYYILKVSTFKKKSNYANHLLNNSQSFDKHPTGPFEHWPFWHLPDGHSTPGHISDFSCLVIALPKQKCIINMGGGGGGGGGGGKAFKNA
jgi:hypothetical protein